VPRAVRSLAGENFGANPFARDAGALRGDRRRGGVRQIAHRLPADGRVRIEQPVDSVHGAILQTTRKPYKTTRMGWVVGWNVTVVQETPALLVLATTTRHYVKDVPENTLTAMNLLKSMFSECSTTAVVRPN
jgi:hypothetical protein